jgi:NADH-quinone oxidoreductase E subunit
MAVACETELTELEEYVERLAAHYGGGKRALLPMLQDIQEQHNYLPRPLLEQVACTLDVSRAHVYRIATFYKAFSLEPRGKYVIQVCLGTSCHLRGGPQLAESIHHQLGISPGETTPDGLFTLETVNCLGACALSPVMLVGKDYHAQVTPERVARILDRYRKEQ